MPKKILSRAEGVAAANILLAINTERESFLRLTRTTELTSLEEDRLYFEWYGFVHAAVTAALMVHAPNIVLAEYLRGTTQRLMQLGMPEEHCPAFIDAVFTPYVDLLAREEQKSCPLHFFHKLTGAKKLEEAPHKGLALISSLMAMALAAIADKLENYDIASE